MLLLFSRLAFFLVTVTAALAVFVLVVVIVDLAVLILLLPAPLAISLLQSLPRLSLLPSLCCRRLDVVVAIISVLLSITIIVSVPVTSVCSAVTSV